MRQQEEEVIQPDWVEGYWRLSDTEDTKEEEESNNSSSTFEYHDII